MPQLQYLGREARRVQFHRLQVRGHFLLFVRRSFRRGPLPAKLNMGRVDLNKKNVFENQIQAS